MPVNYNIGIDLPFTASGDANTWQFNFVKPAGTAKRFIIADGASNPFPLGVLQDDPRSEDVGAVRFFGSTLVKMDAAGTAIGYGDFLACGSTGMAVITTGSVIQGISLTAVSSGASIIGEMLLIPFGRSAIIDNTP